MRDLLTDRETAKLLRVKINSLYKTVDFFDEFDDDEWDLIEGEHFEYVQRHGELKERRFTEEGVEALAKYLEGDQEGLFSKVLESLTQRKRKRKQLLVSRRITQELIDGDGLVEAVGSSDSGTSNVRAVKRCSALIVNTLSEVQQEELVSLVDAVKIAIRTSHRGSLAINGTNTT